MGDIFNEQIIKKESTAKDTALRVLMIVAAIIISFLAFGIVGEFASIVLVAVVFGVYFGFGFLNVEYEYIFTNGELDIDVIYNRNRRKRMFSADVGIIEMMSHVDDKQQDSYYTGAEVTKNYSSGKTKENTYRFVTSYKGKKTVIIFEPNEKLIKSIATKLTRRKLVMK